jgi:riboflavin kinase/FMN adenylyltransferase
MKVFHSVAEAGRALAGQALALGNFDGVHVGHQALFSEALRHGGAAAFTFHPHPGKVLQPDLAPKLITLLPRKLELFAECGLSAAVVQPFSRDYARTPPSEFEAALFDALAVAHVVVGSDFTYGAARGGTVATLREAAAKRGARVHVVAPVTVDGVVAAPLIWTARWWPARGGGGASAFPPPTWTRRTNCGPRPVSMPSGCTCPARQGARGTRAPPISA